MTPLATSPPTIWFRSTTEQASRSMEPTTTMSPSRALSISSVRAVRPARLRSISAPTFPGAGFWPWLGADASADGVEVQSPEVGASPCLSTRPTLRIRQA